MKRASLVTVICLFAFGLFVGLGIKRDRRKPNQHWNQYWAVRELDVWSVFGWEVSARNRLAVYDMTDRTIDRLPRPLNTPSVQVRRFGKIVQGDTQFALGEADYQYEKYIKYIREALRQRAVKP